LVWADLLAKPSRGHGIGLCREAFKGSDRTHAAHGAYDGNELEATVHVFGTLYLDTAYSENSRLLTEAARSGIEPGPR